VKQSLLEQSQHSAQHMVKASCMMSDKTDRVHLSQITVLMLPDKMQDNLLSRLDYLCLSPEAHQCSSLQPALQSYVTASISGSEIIPTSRAEGNALYQIILS